MDRWFGTETALRVSQISHIPVVAVPADGGWHQPRTIVVAVDFSTFSRDALLTALQIAAPGAEIHLICVLDTGAEQGAAKRPEDWRSHGANVRKSLAEWIEETPETAGFKIELHTPGGNPAEEILALAREVDADLIAAGSYGSGFFARTVLGSVSSRVLRATDRAVLITPPRTPARELDAE
jgi:nucleotide-binding universal stress UspA family protein